MWIVGATVFAISLGIYLTILPSQLSWANYGNDSGDFLAALLTGGVPHPTGYPAYLLAGSLFMLIPAGTPVWRAALISAVSAALAVALLVTWIYRLFIKSGLPNLHAVVISSAVGLSLSLSPILFSQAVIVEVYGFQTIFSVVGILWLAALTSPAVRGQDWKPAALLALLYAFGLGNHITGILAAPPAVYLLLRSLIDRKWKVWSPQLIAILIGLSVYLVLPLRASAAPPINWGNPITLDGFLWLVTGSPYQDLLFTAQPVRILGRVSALAKLLLQQFAVPGIFFGVLGLVQKPFIRRDLHLCLIWLASAYSIFAIGYATDDSTAYLIPVFIVWAVWMALGMGWAVRLVWRRIPVGWLAAAVFLGFTIAHLPATIRSINPRLTPQAGQAAERILRGAPRGALLLTSGDLDTFPIWYQHFGLHAREDLRVIVLPLTQFEWYRDSLQHTYPDLNYPTQDMPGDQWGEKIPAMNTARPACRTRIDKQSTNILLLNCVPD